MTFTKKHFAVAICLVIICWAMSQRANSAAPGPGATIWEYKVASGEGEIPDLNGFGREGWELVTLNNDNNLYTAVFKRQKP
jgi:hypothetical protein